MEQKIAVNLSSPAHTPLNRLPRFLVSARAKPIIFAITQKTSRFCDSGSVAFVSTKNPLINGSSSKYQCAYVTFPYSKSQVFSLDWVNLTPLLCLHYLSC